MLASYNVPTVTILKQCWCFIDLKFFQTYQVLCMEKVIAWIS